MSVRRLFKATVMQGAFVILERSPAE